MKNLITFGEFGEFHSGVAEDSILGYGTASLDNRIPDVSGQVSKRPGRITLDVKTREDEGTAFPEYVRAQLSIEAESYHLKNDSFITN
jgi:hypothetical protein